MRRATGNPAAKWEIVPAGETLTGFETLKRGLYARPLITLAEQLPAIAEWQSAQLYELYRAPTAERCARVASELASVGRLLMRLREALTDDAAGGSALR